MDRLVVDVTTYGCKVNTYDSGLMQKRIAAAGIEVGRGDADGGRRVHLLNTCAVTAEATKEALRQARRLKRRDPDSLVVVTGCSAQVDTELFAAVKEVDLVVANSHKGELANLIQRLAGGDAVDKVQRSNIFKKDDLEMGGGEELNHTRSFLKIQDGCDSFCTFCVIPFARGKSRSIEPDELVSRINELEARGVREVVLTGVHIGDYLAGDGQDLTDLVATVLERTTMPRLRLSSLEPIELNARLLDLFQNPRLCRHFHMSIQSGSTTVLSKMKRNYTAEQVAQSLAWIERSVPGAYVGIDVIAGFPEESETEFAETFACLNETPWTRLHVFPYSARPGTYAARALTPVAPEVIRARAARLRELSCDRQAERAIAQVGRQKAALILRGRGERCAALTRDYWPVTLDLAGRGPLAVGDEVMVRVTGAERHESATGELRLYAKLEP